MATKSTSKALAGRMASPRVYLHGGPGSGCQPDHRRLFDPERFHAVFFDQRGAGRSRPKGRREDNTLPHLIVDMEMIREKFGFERWIIVGGSWARRWRWPTRKRIRIGSAASCCASSLRGRRRPFALRSRYQEIVSHMTKAMT